MITKEIALSLHHGQELWHNKETNADGTPRRARVNGKCKTWKTRPEDWRVPMKWGLKRTFQILSGHTSGWEAPNNWSLPDRWAVERHWTEPQP